MKFKLFLILIISFYTSASFAENQWIAKRITATENQNESNSWMNFIKEFEIENLPEKAISKIACDSKYWLWVNGEMAVFEGQLKRGPTPQDTYYDEVDISPYLQKGQNKIAILVWYFGKDGFSHNSSDEAGLVVQCNTLGLVTDETWLAKVDKAFENTSRPYPNFRLPESNIRFDARLGNFDWVKPGTLYNEFGNAKVLGDAESSPWNKLIVRPVPQWKNYGLKQYIGLKDLPFISEGDTIIVDLPYNAQITPYFKIDSKAAEKIEIRTDHYFGGGPPNVRAEYVTREGIQEYESPGWMNGHKVRYFFPKGVKVIDLKYRETGYDSEFTGHFHCNDPFFDKLWVKAVRTLYVTMRDTYMDCPDRERSQWWGDVVNESGEAFYALSPEASLLTRKAILELINWQRDDGTIYSPVPSGNWDKELPGQMLASVGYYGFWNYYLNTGDIETIKKVYEGVKRYLDVWEINENGILKSREGAWYWGDWGINIDKQGLYNAWYYLALKGFRNMSELLGNSKETSELSQKMLSFKIAFNEQFWSGNEYRTPEYKGETDDRFQALAVVAGLADSEKFSSLYNILQTQEYASPYMEKYVIEALFQMGYPEYGLKRLKKRFSTMVKDTDRSTLYEGWGIGNDGFGGGSANHAWSGGGLTILSQYVCGLTPVAPGWKIFELKPQLAGLDYAEAGNLMASGKIETAIKKEGRTLKIKVVIPEGVAGIICIPDNYPIVKLNNTIIWDKKFQKNGSSEFVENEDSCRKFSVGQGEWYFIAE